MSRLAKDDDDVQDDDDDDDGLFMSDDDDCDTTSSSSFMCQSKMTDESVMLRAKRTAPEIMSFNFANGINAATTVITAPATMVPLTRVPLELTC
jgi:hypothetical protein